MGRGIGGRRSFPLFLGYWVFNLEKIIGSASPCMQEKYNHSDSTKAKSPVALKYDTSCFNAADSWACVLQGLLAVAEDGGWGDCSLSC